MKKGNLKRFVAMLCAMALLGGSFGAVSASAAPADWANYSGVRSVTNPNGLVLKYHVDSGVSIRFDATSGNYFKDLNKNGRLDAYEDWRNDVDTRVANLLSLMDTNSKLALMSHGGSTSNYTQGFRQAVQRSADSVTTKGNMADGANGNGLQKNCEATTYGIPFAFSTDPRHTGASDPGGIDHGDDEPIEDWPDDSVSRWPNTSALSNTFSTEWHKKFGATKATEYITQQVFQELGPLYDQTTDPRWSRNTGAVSEDYDLLIDLVQAEVEGMQTANASYEGYGLPAGWGRGSVSAMAKHMLGTGSGEFGYEGHTEMGAWSVYPANGWRKMTEAMCAAGGIGTQPKDSVKQVNAVMTQYSMPTNNAAYGLFGAGDMRFSAVGGAFNRYIMTGILREEKGWDGMITSDWGVYGSGFGVTNAMGITTAGRILISWVAGMDQLGGYGTFSEMLNAYNLGITGSAAMGIPAYGQAYMDALVDNRAGHSLKTLFKLGLFEDPYTDPDWAKATVGNSELVKLGYQAHEASIVMLKNHNNILPLGTNKTKVAYTAQVGTSWGLNRTVLSRYYTVPSTIMAAGNDAMALADKQAAAAQADFAIVKFTGPSNGNGTAGRAQSVQFAPYTKTVGRKVSIGGYWYHEDGSRVMAWEIPNPLIGDYKENRANIGYTNPGMQSTLDMIMETRELMGNKPVIAILDYRTPTICAEFEPYVDAIIASCQGSDTAYMEVITGIYEPSGMLSSTWPRSMDLVEMSNEDVPDTTPYVDSDNNVYQFGFGLNYSGRIADERTQKYLGFSEIKEYELGETVTVPIELLPYKYGPAGVTASVYYNKAELKLVSMTAANGFLLVNDGDQFTLTTSNGAGCTAGAVAGYAVFEAVNGAKFDASKVTFAMDRPATDGDLNATMARFADAIVAAITIPGDVNCDGVVDVTDVVMLLQYLAGSRTLTARQLEAADVNADGSVNVGDVTIIMEMTLA